MPRAIKTPPNTTYHVSRTCQDDLCLLAGERVAGALFYLLALVAPVLGIRVHAAAVLPHRWDIILTDVRGVVARLFEIVHLAAARWINRVNHNRSGSVWRLGRRVKREILTSQEEVLAHTASILAGPVRAGLAEHGGSYAKYCTRPKSLGDKRSVRRPDGLSLPGKVLKVLPSSVVFKTTCPPQFASLALFKAALTEALEEAEERARAEATTRFATLGEVEALEPTLPLTQLPTIDAVRAEAHDAHLEQVDAARARRQRAEQRAWFAQRYLPAWLRFTDGQRDTEFPADTYWMFFIARCEIEAPPPDAALFV
jgi:hypothetical protein